MSLILFAEVFISRTTDYKQLSSAKTFGFEDRFNNKDTSEDINKVVKLPWIPITGPKLRPAFKKKNIKTIFTSGSNLKSLLYRNKTKLLPNSYPGVYELKCSCLFW